MLLDDLGMVTRLVINSILPNNDGLHSDHSVRVLLKSVRILCPVSLGRHPA